jgi:hypothetical protein
VHILNYEEIEGRKLIRDFEADCDIINNPVTTFDPLTYSEFHSNILKKWEIQFKSSEDILLLALAVYGAGEYWLPLLSSVKDLGLHTCKKLLKAYANKPFLEIALFEEPGVGII